MGVQVWKPCVAKLKSCMALLRQAKSKGKPGAPPKPPKRPGPGKYVELVIDARCARKGTLLCCVAGRWCVGGLGGGTYMFVFVTQPLSSTQIVLPYLF